MSRRRRKPSRPATSPYVPGSRHEVSVERLDGHPAALARDRTGRAMRVPGGVPGDTLEVEVVARGRSDIWTRVTETLKPGRSRVEPPCAILDRCGACPWQRVRYREQLGAKARVVREALARHPELSDARVAEPQGVTPPIGYRTKIQMPFGGRPGLLFQGLYAPRSHDLVRIRSCPVQHPEGERIRAEVTRILDGHALAPFDEASGEGALRYLLIRVADGTGEIGVVLVVADLEAFDWALLAAELTAVEGLTGVWVNENPTRGNAVLGERTVHLAGARRLRDQIRDIALERTPTGFFQTNHRAAALLVDTVRELAPPAVAHLADVYAGGGLLTLALAGRAERLSLIESHPDAVAAARASLRAAGRDADIHLGRAADMLGRLEAVDLMLLDPPRSGVSEDAHAAIAGLAPPRVLYVSCHLRSLVRDARALAAAGYALAEVRSVDMFPHTPHLEMIADFRR